VSRFPDDRTVILCAALHEGRFLSCAHLSQAVREACEEHGASPELVAEIENELGVSLDEPTEERQADLAARGLVPK
jgi:hypothetical protein